MQEWSSLKLIEQTRKLKKQLIELLMNNSVCSNLSILTIKVQLMHSNTLNGKHLCTQTMKETAKNNILKCLKIICKVTSSTNADLKILYMYKITISSGPKWMIFSRFYQENQSHQHTKPQLKHINLQTESNLFMTLNS